MSSSNAYKKYDQNIKSKTPIVKRWAHWFYREKGKLKYLHKSRIKYLTCLRRKSFWLTINKPLVHKMMYSQMNLIFRIIPLWLSNIVWSNSKPCLSKLKKSHGWRKKTSFPFSIFLIFLYLALVIVNVY